MELAEPTFIKPDFIAGFSFREICDENPNRFTIPRHLN